MRRRAPTVLVLLAASCLAWDAIAATLAIQRDQDGRIARVVIDDDGGTSGRKGSGRYTIEAAPGQDVRGGAVRLQWENDVAGGVVRAEGVAIETAAPLPRDAITGVATEPAPPALHPSAAVFASLEHPSANDVIFGAICATSIGSDFTTCPVLWSASAIPLVPYPAGAPFEPVPPMRSERDEALLGCGAAYETSCEQDGLDLRFASASVLYQRFPGLGGGLPEGGDSAVLARITWNWFAGQAMRTGTTPGEGDASACTFATPAGCASLETSPFRRFAARRVLPDEPIPGPDVRWDWEMGTTFELGPLETEGDVPPALLDLLPRAGGLRVHVIGPFAGAGGEPDAAVHWVPEPKRALAAVAAVLALAALRRRA